MVAAVTVQEMLTRLERQTALPEIALGLERVLAALAALGNPQEKLPPVVHIAGTNGKGSTLAYLRAMHEAAGLRVHAYTSPHLVRFNERILLAGQEIDDATLEAVLARVLAEMDAGIALTYFEATTLAAFLAFSETQADVLLLEVGMGGRLDATNIVARPALCILTPIAMDHAEYLGETIAQIAAEKAGILKPGVPAVVAPQVAEAFAVIEAQAKALKVPLYVANTAPFAFPKPALAGEHQEQNAMVAALAGQRLGLPQEAIRQGIANAHWPARLQLLTQGPLLAGGMEVWLDGGHNAHAAAALLSWLHAEALPTTLIAGMMQRKDMQAFFTALSPWNGPIITVTPDAPGAATATQLEQMAQTAGMQTVTAAKNLDDAMGLAAKTGARRVLICGSLYLAGQVLKTHS